MNQTILVVGMGLAYAAPDTAVVHGEVTGVVSSYAEAVEASAHALSSMRKAMGESGFDMDNLRTTGMSVDLVYVDEDGRRVMSGYRYRHGMSVTVDSDGETLGRLLSVLTQCDDAPEFQVSYTTRDPSVAMSNARIAAVKDARRRAKELAAAAGVRLGDLVSIEYVSQGRQVAPMGRMPAVMAVDVVPTDVEFRDSVTMKWEII